MNINKLKKEISSPDYIFKEINISGIKTYLIFNEVLTNSQRIDEITWYLITKIKRSDFKYLIYKFYLILFFIIFRIIWFSFHYTFYKDFF